MRLTAKLFFTLGIIAVVGVIAAACGGDQAPKSANKTPSGAEAPKAASPSPTASAPEGGVFRRLWMDPPTLDPHLANDTSSAGLIVEVFSGLVTISPALTIEPDIAERWDIGTDHQTYTFYLRKDAKFHDGKAVTAKDFKYSFERATDPRLLSPVADTYLGEIQGAKDKIEGRATEVSGVKVIDNYTLQITTVRPMAYFLAMLTYPTAYVVDQSNIERLGRNWASQPNGTGPFKLKEYRIGERVVLERNPLYYREPAKLDRIEYILSGGSPMAMYENDEIDMTGVGIADIDRVRDPKDPLNKEVHATPPGFTVSYIGFNTAKPPFDDVNVRRALNFATNKELIAKEILSGLAIPAYGILPKDFPGYTGQTKGLTFDAAKARQAMAASKYAAPNAKDLLAQYESTQDPKALADFQAATAGKLPRMVLTVPGTGGGLGLDLEVIVEMWKEALGLNVEFQQVEWATFLQDLNAKKLQVFSGLGWQADYPDPQNFLDVLFYSKSDTNHGAYANQELDKVLEEARSEPDWNKRVALYQKAEQLVLDDAAWVPLWFSTEVPVLIKPRVKNYKLLPLIVPHMRDVYIDKG
ncbi:MAG: peptide ABC transporter substrate-binding protein [Dehalococcoidia bacterium]|nr:peptide ABC transporter substrate-binding protein [Dehalococcoidia bacterium]